MRLARVLHSTVGLIAAGHSINFGVLNSIKAASDTILGGNRDATDAELLALENLIDQLVPEEAQAEQGDQPAPVAHPAPVLPELPPSGGQEPGVGSSEAGGASAPSESESVTAVAPPEASSEAPAEPMQDEGDTLVEPVTAPPVQPAEELFQPQEHDEAEHTADDDGA